MSTVGSVLMSDMWSVPQQMFSPVCVCTCVYVCVYVCLFFFVYVFVCLCVCMFVCLCETNICLAYWTITYPNNLVIEFVNAG